MSSTEWIGASQVTRSATGSRIGLVSSFTSGSSSQASGNASISFAVELGVGLDVDRGALVLALQVERVDGARLDQLPDQLVGPVVGRVELEAQGRVDLEPLADRLDRGDLVGSGRRQPHRDDEGDRPRLAPEHLVQRLARLAQRQVERGALERPAAVVDRDLALGRAREQRRRPSSSSENESIVCSPARSSTGPASWRAMWSSAS